MKTRIDEISPGLYRISTHIKKVNLQFNQFLMDDDEPLLFSTGMRGLFDNVREAAARVMDPARIRWIGFSHFEADECGALNEWLSVAPEAEPFCGHIGAAINIHDYANRHPRILSHGEFLTTGRKRYRFLETPHVPHGWDATLLFEETAGALFCSDLFLHQGNLPPVTNHDPTEAARQALLEFQAGPLADSIPYTNFTGRTLQMLSELSPDLIAIMHGSSFIGDGKLALLNLAAMYGDTLKTFHSETAEG